MQFIDQIRRLSPESDAVMIQLYRYRTLR